MGCRRIEMRTTTATNEDEEGEGEDGYQTNVLLGDYSRRALETSRVCRFLSILQIKV